MRSFFVIAVLLALPGPVTAQAGPDPSAQERISATAGLMLKGSQIAQENRLHFGGWAGLLFTDNLAIGGGGFALINDIELVGSEGDTGFLLDMGYGGLLFRYWETLRGPLMGDVGLLLGAAHAEVRDNLTSGEVGSDNFFIAEADFGLSYSLARDFHLGISLGYRFTSGVEDLPRVSAGDINGFTSTISVQVGGH